MENIAKDVMEIPLLCEVEKTYKTWSSSDKIKVKL